MNEKSQNTEMEGREIFPTFKGIKKERLDAHHFGNEREEMKKMLLMALSIILGNMLGFCTCSNLLLALTLDMGGKGNYKDTK